MDQSEVSHSTRFTGHTDHAGASERAKKTRRRWIVLGGLGAALGLAVVSGAVGQAGGLRALLRMDPVQMDYAPLRASLEAARSAAVNSLSGTVSFGTNAAVDGLSRAIVHSRSNAHKAGVQTIPEPIRAQLEPYFPAHIIAQTRWTYPSRSLDLGSIITAWYRAHGGAVTLQDTIVYSDTNAVSQRYLWAHELTHVMQFDELGVENFARIYLTNPQFLERQAWDNARQVVLAIQSQEITARREAAQRAAEEARNAQEMAEAAALQEALAELEAEAAEAAAELDAIDEAQAHSQGAAD